jgi:hypothetical protein
VRGLLRCDHSELREPPGVGGMQQLGMFDAQPQTCRPGLRHPSFVRVEHRVIGRVADGVRCHRDARPHRTTDQVVQSDRVQHGEPAVARFVGEVFAHVRGVRAQCPVGEELQRTRGHPRVAGRGAQPGGDRLVEGRHPDALVHPHGEPSLFVQPRERRGGCIAVEVGDVRDPRRQERLQRALHTLGDVAARRPCRSLDQHRRRRLAHESRRLGAARFTLDAPIDGVGGAGTDADRPQRRRVHPHRVPVDARQADRQRGADRVQGAACGRRPRPAVGVPSPPADPCGAGRACGQVQADQGQRIIERARRAKIDGVLLAREVGDVQVRVVESGHGHRPRQLDLAHPARSDLADVGARARGTDHPVDHQERLGASAVGEGDVRMQQDGRFAHVVHDTAERGGHR